jgi:pimeloyl-ACP methyl ester carboxylesterase
MDRQTGFDRQDNDFVSQGVRCAAWLYVPQGAQNPPLIIMAHGLSGERSFGLPAYAERFAAQGWASLVFDYRCFGDSDGTPRDKVDPLAHGEDWDAAIAHARTLGTIDTSRIVLWGSSFSGAHVVCAAARDAEIAATISQVPFSGTPADAEKPPLGVIVKMAASMLMDKIQTAVTGNPLYIPVVGPPGSAAILNTPECEPGYLALIPGDRTFNNRIPVSSLGLMMKYDPLGPAEKVQCPALVVAGRDDSLIPVSQAELMASKLPKGEFEVLDCNHFAPYRGEWFEKNVDLQINFLKRVLA